MTNSADSTVASPAHVNGAHYPKPTRRKPVRITRQRRERMEEIVDGLLRLLDELDGDPDEEPSLGVNPSNPSRAAVDCEDEHDGAEPDEDGEPSLGWTATIPQQGFKWLGDTNDAEDEHDGREPDVDDEEDDPAEDGGDAEPDNDGEPSHCGVTVDVEHAMMHFSGLAPLKNNRRRRQSARGLLIDHDPRNLPPRYVMVTDGHCMEPEIPDGTKLLFDTTEPPKRGDVVAFYLRRDRTPPGAHQVRVKRLASKIAHGLTFPFADLPGSTVRQMLVFELNNPRGQFAVPCSDILAVHKCIGEADPATTRMMTAKEKAELRIGRGMPAI